MERLPKEVNAWIVKSWHQPSTAGVVVLLIALALLFWFADADISRITGPELLVVAFLCLVFATVWYLFVRPPRCSRKRVGIAIAIAAESQEEYRVIAADFIGSMRRLADSGGADCNLTLIEIPQRHAIKVTTKEDAAALRQRCRCQFLVWGTARLRPLGGRDKHILSLQGLVHHSLIPIPVSKQFSAEFSELFPRNIHVDKENDMLSLEFTSEWIDCAARYVIGVAAGLSGAIDYAENIYLSIHTNRRLKDCPLPAIKKIRQRTPERLGEIYALRAGLEFKKWRKTKSREALEDMHINLIELAKVHQANYQGRLMRAVYHFLSARNVDAALKELTKCREIPDGGWRYSQAFLYAYRGDMHRARRMYKAAFHHPCGPSTPMDVEEFIHEILDEEPDKVQLYFCLGLVNWHAKDDIRQARADFLRFLNDPDANQFPEEKRLALAYVDALAHMLSRDQLEAYTVDGQSTGQSESVMSLRQ